MNSSLTSEVAIVPSISWRSELRRTRNDMRSLGRHGAARPPATTAAGARSLKAQERTSETRQRVETRGGWTVSRVASCYTHAEAARPRIAFRCVILDNAGGTRTDVTSHPPRAPLVRLQDALTCTTYLVRLQNAQNAQIALFEDTAQRLEHQQAPSRLPGCCPSIPVPGTMHALGLARHEPPRPRSRAAPPASRGPVR